MCFFYFNCQTKDRLQIISRKCFGMECPKLRRFHNHGEVYFLFCIFFIIQTLVRSLEVSEKLIAEYKLEWQKKYDEITSDWLAAKCHAMCLKIRYAADFLIFCFPIKMPQNQKCFFKQQLASFVIFLEHFKSCHLSTFFTTSSKIGCHTVFFGRPVLTPQLKACLNWGLFLKIIFCFRVLQNQMLCDTYTPESVCALKQIR